MITDTVPRQAGRKRVYDESDVLRAIDVPPQAQLRALADDLERAMKMESPLEVKRACQALADFISDHYRVKTPPISVLGVRPHRTSAGVCVYEKFGDYNLETALIRLWMRTAMKHKVTSYGCLLSTLTHELVHHLDMVRFGFPGTPHTRGFYERAALLYHQAKGTPLKPLVWVRLKNGTYRIDWGKTMRGTP